MISPDLSFKAVNGWSRGLIYICKFPIQTKEAYEEFFTRDLITFNEVFVPELGLCFNRSGIINHINYNMDDDKNNNINNNIYDYTVFIENKPRSSYLKSVQIKGYLGKSGDKLIEPETRNVWISPSLVDKLKNIKLTL